MKANQKTETTLHQLNALIDQQGNRRGLGGGFSTTADTVDYLNEQLDTGQDGDATELARALKLADTSIKVVGDRFVVADPNDLYFLGPDNFVISVRNPDFDLDLIFGYPDLRVDARTILQDYLTK